MTTFLYNIILGAGSDRMAQTDPHGWTLTLISVSVVFIALLILYGLYSLSGSIFSGKINLKRKPVPVAAKDDEAVAAAIALALDAELNGSETEVAIATALHLYLSEAVHDIEPGIITIRGNKSDWNLKSRNFRKSPQNTDR